LKPRAVMRSIISVDRVTGEVVEGVAMLVPPRHRNGFTEGWLAMGMVNMAKLAADTRLGVQAHRVLLVVLANTGYGNEVTCSQAEIARALGMPAQNVNRAWRQLVACGVLRELDVQVGTVGLRKAWVVSPEVAWRGEAKLHKLALREWAAGVGVPQ
jgi:hypothetical protein